MRALRFFDPHFHFILRMYIVLMEENLKVQFRYGNAIQDKDSVEQQLKVICGDDVSLTDPIDQLAYGKDYILIYTRWTLDGY